MIEKKVLILLRHLKDELSDLSSKRHQYKKIYSNEVLSLLSDRLTLKLNIDVSKDLIMDLLYLVDETYKEINKIKSNE